jgi:hypothetical protein
MTETRLWRLRLWPFTFHFALSRSPSGASCTIGIFVWKLAVHFSLATMD